MKWNIDLTGVDGMKILLGIIAGFVIVLEIYLIDDMSKIEGTLFNILQFVFSVSFAWVLSKSSSEKEFIKSQKKFAISAYRRILEIENTNIRLLNNITGYMNDFPKEYYHQMVVLEQTCQGIKDTVKSSISDWADIIGDEIKTISKIEGVKTVKESLALEKRTQKRTQKEQPEKDIILKNKIESLENDIALLYESLPAQLQIFEQDINNNIAEVNKWHDLLMDELLSTGQLELNGFWEPNNGFEDLNCEELKGKEITIKPAKVGSRSDALIAFTSSGKPFGVITNRVNLNYDNFKKILVSIYDAKPIKAKFIDCEPKEECSSDRRYFHVESYL